MHPSRNGSEVDRAPKRAAYTISSRDIVSRPQWVNSIDAEVIDQVVLLENEKQGVPLPPGPGRLLTWRAVDLDGTRTLVQSLTIPWEMEKTRATEFSGFVPWFAFFGPPPDSAVLWKEGSQLIAGFSRGDRWVHVVSLGDEKDPNAIAAEIDLTLRELGGRGLIDGVQNVVVWDEMEASTLGRIEQVTGLDVIPGIRPEPKPPAEKRVWGFEPHSVSQRKIEKRRRQRMVLALIGAVCVLVAVGAVAFSHLQSLEAGNRMLEQRISANREAADRVEVAMDRWQQLGPVVDPARSPVELFYRVSLLVPEKGFRLTSFEVLDLSTIVVRGEASTMSNALQVKGRIEEAEMLSDYVWEIPPPKSKGELTEFFAIGRYRYIDEE